MQLVQELEMAVGRLPEVKTHRDVQAEIDIALQPLRTENCQLRRYLLLFVQSYIIFFLPTLTLKPFIFYYNV